MNMTRTAKDLIILAVFTLLCLLPFISKPFNVDDPFYIRMAEHIQKDPARPYSFSINWSGETRNAWDRMEATFPPLIPYYIAATASVTGFGEVPLHLAFLIFPLIAAASMYFILKKYSDSPLPYALIFASAPAFLVTATSIMLDIPLTAMMLASVALFIYGVDEDRTALVAVGSVLAGLAVLVKYSGILCVLVSAVYLIHSGKKKYVPYLLVPAAVFGLWCIHNIAVYGKAHFFEASKHVGKGLTTHKMIAIPAFFSGCLIFPAFLFFILDIREKLIVVTLSSMFYVIVEKFIPSWPSALLYTILVAGTAVFIYGLIKRREETGGFVFIWFVLASMLIISVEPWVSGRYILGLLPPSLIIFAQLADKTEGRLRLLLPRAALGFTLALGLGLAAADQIWARAALKIPAYLKQNGVDKGFFVGHYGFQYYMEKEGFTALEVAEPLKGPAYLIAAKMPDPQKPCRETIARMDLLEHRAIRSGFPLRVVSPSDHAGFYSSFWGIMPFAVSRAPVEEFALFRVKK